VHTVTYHRIYLPTLRALCNSRNVSLAALMDNAGEGNVGAQQVDVAAPESFSVRGRA
jgi:hypothetical protein